jgi:ribonuclease Y
MGINVRRRKRAGLLHDIGKAVTHEVEGGHAVIGGQMARKAGEDDMVVNAIAAHHDDEPPRACWRTSPPRPTPSAARGRARGARCSRGYVRRLEDLEKICGASRAWSGASRSRRAARCACWWSRARSTTLGALALSRDIARKIESELAYPGQIRVTVVRETRAVDYAR